jgi:hypothetical protein
LFHCNQYVEVNQTVVNWGNQSVGHAVGDQAEMLHATRRIDDDEIVFVRASNFLELRYELPQISAMTQGAIADEVVFVRSPTFLEPRYEPSQGTAMYLFRDRIMIGQLQFLLVLPIPIMSISKVPGDLGQDRKTRRAFQP